MARTIVAVIQRLVDTGVGVSGTTILAGNAPNNVPPAGVDAHLVIHETGGRPPQGTHNEGFTAERLPSFQIVAKASRYPDAAAKAEQAYDALRLVNTTISGVFFLTMYPLQDPFELPPDPNGKLRVAFNIATHRRG